MRLSVRQLFILTCSIVAGAKIAGAQTVTNPQWFEFSSVDHAVITSYRFCFYASSGAPTPVRCNDVPQASAVLQSGTTYRVQRTAAVSGLANATNYWFKVASVNAGGASAEVAPDTAPFSFRLEPAPAAVTAVRLIP